MYFTDVIRPNPNPRPWGTSLGVGRISIANIALNDSALIYDDSLMKYLLWAVPAGYVVSLACSNDHLRIQPTNRIAIRKQLTHSSMHLTTTRVIQRTAIAEKHHPLHTERVKGFVSFYTSASECSGLLSCCLPRS